ncbi:MAG: hypothetical protein WCO45_16470 [Pseudanabaena sp. ELA607]
MSMQRCLWTASFAVVSATVAVFPTTAEPLTDANHFPRGFPATYPNAINRVLDMDSSTNIPNPWMQYDFRDVEIERQFNAFRTVNRDMLDLQTLGKPTVRTRDLPSAYTSSLLTEGWTNVAPVEVPVPANVVPSVQTETAPANNNQVAPRSVPALW